jgi:hypothetical protein
VDITWSSVKEVFFAIGSVAGVFALLKPLVESKFQRDSARIERIKSLISEQRLVDLEHRINQHREVPCKDFEPFDQLAHERRTNQEVVRFSGPLSKALTRELDAMLTAYSRLRDFIQVNEWVPRDEVIDGIEYRSWNFNKNAFKDRDGIHRNYAQHLDQAAEQAVQIKKAFQRFQLVAELHLFEVPLAWWLLPKRFKSQSL